jgi:TonB family protein
MLRLPIFSTCFTALLSQTCLAEDYSIYSTDSAGSFHQINLSIDRDSIVHYDDLIMYRIRWYNPYTNARQTETIVANCAERRRGRRERYEAPESVSLYSVYAGTKPDIELDIACGAKPSPNLKPIPQISVSPTRPGVAKDSWTPEEIDGLFRQARRDEVAFDDLSRAAEKGYTQAQIDLAGLYLSGFGVSTNYLEAMRWYAKAAPALRQGANAGDAVAQFELGRLYFYGEGLTQNRSEAEFLWRGASDKGYAPAKLALAQQYFLASQIGLRTDEKKRDDAARLAREAAEAGDVEAQYLLGSLYDSGKGGVKNPEAALNWYRKAADQGHATAQYKVGMAYLKGDGGVQQDYALAGKLLLQSATHGNMEAAYEIGELYYKGQGLSEDDAQAAVWLRRAAERGFNRQAEARLAELYREGRGVPKDEEEAKKWQDLSEGQMQTMTTVPPKSLGSLIFNGTSGPAATADASDCKPEYPPAARQAKEEGKVRIFVSIGIDDKVLSRQVIGSSGYDDLDRATLDSLNRCKFKAAKDSDGKSQQSFMVYEYLWALEASGAKSP